MAFIYTRRQRAWQFTAFMAAFFVAWSFRATSLYSVDEQITSPLLRTAYSNLLKLLLWVLPAAIFASRLRLKSAPFYLGVSVKPDGRAWLHCLLAIGAFLIVVGGLETALGHKSLSLAGVLSIPVTVLLLQFGLTPLLEEILFRGLVMQEFVTFLPTPLAGIATSLLFVGAHLPYWLYHGGPTVATAASSAGVFVFSLLACWLYARSSSVWPSAVAHAANNLLAAMLVVR